MRFAILGPLLVHDGETPVDVPRGRQRVLLAALLLHTGNPVAADALAEVVWDGAPPPGAEITLRSHVLRLRRALGPRAGARLVTRHPGYLLQAGDDEVDVLQFRCLCRDGGTALRAGAWERADALLGAALDLWRGTPLTGIPSESLRRDQGQDLETLRLQAEEWRTGAALHLGRHAELVHGLQSLAAQHPLREPFHSQLMLALYRCGRQAEALAAYQHARDVLVAELGTEPGPELQELHQQILSADPALAGPEPTRPAEGEPQRAVPRELPPAVPGFTGRSAELRALTRLLDRPRQQAPEAIVISAIDGTAGVGKTALAVHWAHQAASRFPEGQLYVNLRGYDPGQPVPAADALASFLRSLGVSGQDIPPEADERAARYRSLLAGKQMLVVLDNAGSADQVRPLLPGTSACTVLVTSRDALAGLVARDGATRLDLDVLLPQDAVALLRTLIGARVDADPAAAAELAGQCCRLPLALRVAAELAASRPDASLAALTYELADLRTRLDQLEAGGDPRTQVRTVFSWSYRHLDLDTARTFRLLGLHPGPDVDPYATAALTGTTMPQARRTLDVLARAHLIQPTGPGRYGMHDLLRSYARELTTPQDTGQAQNAALTRLFDHYLHAAAIAMDRLFPADRHRRPSVTQSATPVPPLADPVAARTWLDAELAALVAVTAHAAEHGWPDHAIRFAATLFRYLDLGGHYLQAISIHAHAHHAAEQTGDHVAEASALTSLGLVDVWRGRAQQAIANFQHALDLFREVGNRGGEARALHNLGVVNIQQCRYQQAADYQQQALNLYREGGDQSGEIRALQNLGLIDARQGRYQQAAGHYVQALNVSRQTGDRNGEAHALENLSDVDSQQGRYQLAADRCRQALALYRETCDRQGEAHCLADLGDNYRRQGRHREAAGHYREALVLFREIGNPVQEADALNGLGDVLLQTGDADKASEYYDTALRLASEADAPREQARAHGGLARACQAVGASLQARHHWQEALTRYAAIGAPEADEIRVCLAIAADGGDDGDKPTAEEDGGTTAISPG